MQKRDRTPRAHRARFRQHVLLSCTAAVVLLGGCSMAPKLEVTPPALPDANTTATGSDVNQSVNMKWWEDFHDANLNTLIDEALKNNDDLMIAASRVAQAAAALGYSRAERYPTVDGSAAANRQQTSHESFSPVSGFIYNNFNLSVSASYELDFWGKYRNLEAAARAKLIATAADQDTVRITLVTSVAELYFNLIGLRQQIKVTEETVQAYKESYEYRLRQFSHGVIDGLTLEQAHALYASAKVSLAGLREERILAENAMAILLGRSPKAMLAQAYDTAPTLPKPLVIPSDLTSKLLERRPDILAAESQLREANAMIGVARAAYFPTISLTGSGGLSSSSLDNLMQSSAKTWGIGASLYVPLLDFGRISSTVEEAEAKKDEAVSTYAKTVKTAFKEVFDSLATIQAAQRKLTAQDEANRALNKVLTLSQQRFNSGYGTYLEVIEAKRALLASRLNLIKFTSAMVTDQIRLYKALGGGWQRPDNNATSAQKSASAD
jgi:outer membrane protein, multidrug efflux system